MPRGRRKATTTDLSALEQEMALLRQRQAELRAAMRRLRSGATGVRKLEEKLAKQFATAKWTVGQIKAIDPHYDEMGFYHRVEAKQPAPRGRRPRVAAE